MDNKIKFGKRVLETLTVALYENPIILFREYVQNSLDAYNDSRKHEEKIVKDFHVAINIDENCKKIEIVDNGYGIGNNLFENKMLSIGGSDKAKDKMENIGFRGIGRISGLPFCEKLVFINKAKNSDIIRKCTWDGEKYRKLLNTESFKDDLESIIKEIVKFEDENIGHEKTDEHFFKVVLEGYTEEIEGIIKSEKLKARLIKILPLKYKDSFKRAEKILNKYKEFMNEPMEKFTISVKYNNENLFKAYDDKFILGSDIVFWPVRGKRKQNGAIGDKIGLLWFTFDKHLKSKTSDEYYGILTRSKNVLMGTNDTFAQVANDNKSYVTTFREMAQALRGVYGELLVNSQFLSDNARRDWFLPGQHSVDLSNIITDFMRRLHKYRYCASQYFRSKSSTEKDDLIKALDELVNVEYNPIDYDYFCKKEIKENMPLGYFSEQDMPRQSQSMKKCYDFLMKIIEDFFKKTKNRTLFLKLRVYIKEYFQNK